MQESEELSDRVKWHDEKNNESEYYLIYAPAIFKVEENIVFEHVLPNKEFETKNALKGIYTNIEEQDILNNYAKEFFLGIKDEYKAEKEFSQKISQYIDMADLYVMAGSAIASYGGSLFLFENIGANLLIGFMGVFAGLYYEKKYRKVTSFLAGVKSRKIGDMFHPKKIRKPALEKLENLEEHSQIYRRASGIATITMNMYYNALTNIF